MLCLACLGSERDIMGRYGKSDKNDVTSNADLAFDYSEPLADDAQTTQEMASFYGNFVHLLDDTGRVSLPVSFRQAMGKTRETSVVLTNFITDGARCIDGFSMNSWKRFEAKLSARSRFDPQLRKLENYYLARAAQCVLDGSGRITIPNHLRVYAGFEREVVFTASIQGFRIWDKRVWEMLFQEAESALLDNPSLFLGVDL